MYFKSVSSDMEIITALAKQSAATSSTDSSSGDIEGQKETKPKRNSRKFKKRALCILVIAFIFMTLLEIVSSLVSKMTSQNIDKMLEILSTKNLTQDVFSLE